MANPATIDEYIAGYPADVQMVLTRVRATMHAVLPDAEERIRYGMPALMLGGRYAIHFAAWTHHLGIYPVARADDELERELEPYRAAKDSINFSYDQPIPYELIRRVTAFLARKHAAR